MRIISWIPYILSQILLVYTIVYIRITTNIPENEGYYIGFLIASYGAVLVFSSDIRRYLKNKKLGNNK